MMPRGEVVLAEHQKQPPQLKVGSSAQHPLHCSRATPSV